MLSSISNSEKTASRRDVILLTGLLAAICVATELVGSFGFVHISRIQRRIDTTYKDALRLRPAASDGRPTLLVAGNSLPLEAVDVPGLEKELSSRWQVSGFFIEQTGSMDWYYGLRKLFHDGARPSAILLGLATTHLSVPAVRGEYFAHFMLLPADAFELSARLQLDRTTSSNYFLASLSGWMGAKSEIRKWLLLRSMPDFDEVALLLRPGPPRLPDRLRGTIAENLQSLNKLCHQYGSRLVIVVPPTLDKRDPYEIDQAAGQDAGVPVLVPVHPGDFAPEDFEDGFHLNATGREKFTRAVASELPGALR